MKHHWLIPIVLLLPIRAFAADDQHGRATTLVLQPGMIAQLHLRPEFESVIHLPEEVTSVVVGNPNCFHVERSEAEPTFVYVKRSVLTPAQSDMLIAMKSGGHVVLELISDGDAAPTTTPADFLLEYKPHKSFVVFAGALFNLHPESFSIWHVKLFFGMPPKQRLVPDTPPCASTEIPSIVVTCDITMAKTFRVGDHVGWNLKRAGCRALLSLSTPATLTTSRLGKQPSI